MLHIYCLPSHDLIHSFAFWHRWYDHDSKYRRYSVLRCAISYVRYFHLTLLTFFCNTLRYQMVACIPRAQELPLFLLNSNSRDNLGSGVSPLDEMYKQVNLPLIFLDVSDNINGSLKIVMYVSVCRAMQRGIFSEFRPRWSLIALEIYICKNSQRL